MDHKTKQKVMNVRNRFVGKRESSQEWGAGEELNCILYMYENVKEQI